MNISNLYSLWLENATDDFDLHQELAALSLDKDEEAIHDHFYRHLESGTGGLRGVVGAGANRMNT